MNAISIKWINLTKQLWMNEIRRKCCCDPCCSCKYRRRGWARWWAVRRRCRRSPGRRRTSALRPCAAAAAAAARPDDAAVRTASSGSSFAAKVLKHVTIRCIHDDIKTIYLTEWAWSDGYLIEGHGRYHGDAGTGDEPAQNVGPFRVHVTVVLQRPVVVQSVADNSLNLFKLLQKIIQPSAAAIGRVRYLIALQLNGMYHEEDWSDKLPAHSPVDARAESDHTLDVIGEAVDPLNPS